MKHRLSSFLKHRTFSALSLLTVAVAISTAHADSVKILNDLNYRNVKILEISKGEIHYLTSAGSMMKKSLSQIENISLENVRDLGAAEQDRARNKLSSALTKYKKARGLIGANPKGIGHWVDYQMMRCYDAIGDGNMALKLYMQLQQQRADGFFLEILPERSIDNLTKSQQKEYQSKLKGKLKRARGDTKKQLSALLRMVDSVTFDESGKSTNTQKAVTSNTGNKRSRLPSRRKSKVFFPRAMDVYERDEITSSLRAGDLDVVVKKATEKLKSKNVDYPSMRLLQLGLAQKNQAMQKSGKERAKALKDCAITLLHIPTYYSSNTNWVGAAYAELGMIHIELQSPEVADKLLNDAQAFVNPAKEPELFAMISQAREKINKK